MTSPKTHPLVLPRTLWALFAACLLAIAAIRGTSGTGDHGLDNVLTFLLTMICLIAATVWFLFRSDFDRRVRAVTGVALLAGLVLFFGLFRLESVAGDFIPRFAWRFSPAADRSLDAPVGTVTGTADVRTTTPWDFPQFLGPDRDVSVDTVRLARDWQSSPPELLWRQPIGAGWSGFVVVNGFALTQEQRGDLEMVTCYELETGELVWSYAIENRYESVIAGNGPRATPTINDGVVYAMTNNGRLLALDGADGSLLWEHDVPAEYGLSPEQELAYVTYGRANSPLVHGSLVIVPAGGSPEGRLVSLVAYDKASGDKIWEGGNQQISYASPTVATLAGVEQIVLMNEASVSGHDAESGRQLWEFPRAGDSTADPNSSQPVVIPPNRVFVSKGYGLGGALLEVSSAGAGPMNVREVWANGRVLRTKFSNVTVYEGHVYGLSDGILECVDLESGERVWKHGRYRHGQILRVHDLLLVLSEDGELFLVEATPERRDNVLGQIPVLSGKTWNNFAVYGPYVVVRNGQEAAAFRLPLAD